MIKRFTLAALALLFAIGAANAQGSNILGPATTTVTAGVSATMAALPANPSRKAVTICNGSATLFVTFTTGPTLTPVSLTTGMVLQTANVVSSCFTLGTPGLSTSGGIGAQINVIGSAASVPVTFFEYF